MRHNAAFRYGLTAIIAVSAVALIVLGVRRGEAGEVLQKAIAVCLECVGIG